MNVRLSDISKRIDELCDVLPPNALCKDCGDSGRDDCIVFNQGICPYIEKHKNEPL